MSDIFQIFGGKQKRLWRKLYRICKDVTLMACGRDKGAGGGGEAVASGYSPDQYLEVGIQEKNSIERQL